MPDKKDDGGPAFPQPADATQPSYDDHGQPTPSGMSLRDYFAGQALHSVYFNLSIGNDGSEATEMARLAYLVADAMLKERSEP